MTQAETILLTGATGFVGRYVYPALHAAGYSVRCASRRPERAKLDFPDKEWVRFDAEDSATIGPALAGCDAALFLVHGMGDDAEDYPERERASAIAFREAAAAAGLRRVVYLGGVAPQGRPSRHLQSRLDTGATLREGAASTIELRAAMVVGVGSSSWQMVRDLARRLPAMLLPRWLRNHSWPVSIDDVVAALLIALARPGESSDWYDLPGPERISHRDLMVRVAQHMGKSPRMVSVPVLSPRLSSYWIGLVTRTDLKLARELVEGLRFNLDPSGPSVWKLAPSHALQSLDVTIREALDEEDRHVSPTAEHVQKLEALGKRLAASQQA